MLNTENTGSRTFEKPAYNIWRQLKQIFRKIGVSYIVNKYVFRWISNEPLTFHWYNIDGADRIKSSQFTSTMFTCYKLVLRKLLMMFMYRPTKVCTVCIDCWSVVHKLPASVSEISDLMWATFWVIKTSSDIVCFRIQVYIATLPPPHIGMLDL